MLKFYRDEKMLEFKKLTLADIPRLRGYFSYTKGRACDNTVGVTFMWRDFFSTEYALYEGCAIFKVNYFGKTAFAFPLGENVAPALCAIDEYCSNLSIPLVFSSQTADDVNALRKHFGSVEVSSERDWFDYIYDPSALANLSGKKYHGQKNHVNFFKKTFPDYSFEELSDNNLSYALDFYKKNKLPEKKDSALFLEEQTKIVEIFENISLYGMSGLVLKKDSDSVCAFCIYEICDDTAYVHIEKADSLVRGAYQMIVHGLAQKVCNKTKYINREEDVGDEGLRRAKLSYHPCEFIEKFTVTVPEKRTV